MWNALHSINTVKSIRGINRKYVVSVTREFTKDADKILWQVYEELSPYITRFLCLREPLAFYSYIITAPNYAMYDFIPFDYTIASN